MATYQQSQIVGWLETNSEGVQQLYLCIVDEGMITSPSDTPANTVFTPSISNADTFSIKRDPMVWVWGSTTGQGASFGVMELDNTLGAYDFLMKNDLRDATVVISILPAAMLLTGTAIASAQVMATAIIDDVTCDSEDVIRIALKDTIARLDKPLPCRYNPPFVDASAANQMLPISLGACRNVQPQMIDAANRLFIMHDANVPNVALVMDKGAPLDPKATPPQYVPAVGGSGMQLAVLPQGILSCDICSTGTQASIPGVSDILAGGGLFPGTSNNWTGAYTGGPSTTTSATVTLATGVYSITVTSVTGFAPGQTVYVTDGTNSICQSIASIVGSVIKVNQSGALTTGTPTSIVSGKPVIRAGAPTGFTFTNNGGTISELQSSAGYPFGSTNAVQITTSHAFDAYNGVYGDGIATAANLQPGSSYRLTCSLYNVQAENPALTNGFQGGLVIATNLSANPYDYITGINSPINIPAFSNQTLSFEFTVPPGGGSLKSLYFLAAPSSGASPGTAQGSVTLTIYNIRIQLLGTFTALPLSALSLSNYFTEILVTRAGEASSIFNSSDTAALGVRSDGSLIPFGNHFEGTPPNILDALRAPLDSFGACLFTDNLGVLRCKRLFDPSDPTGRVVVADFDSSNIERPISVAIDKAQGLTTLFGARRNWKTFTPTDFVTDTAIVSATTKAAFSRNSQFMLYSSKVPAGQYSFAIGAPIFDTLLDLAADTQTEGDRICGIYSPAVYKDATFSTGKRRFVTFTAHFDDPTAVGVTTTTNVNNLIFGAIVTLTYPAHGFNTPTYGVIVGWEVFPFAQKITLRILV